MKNGRILISGAGIAGPALAYWLDRHGFTPTIVETAPQLRTGGFAVDVRGPGADVVKRMALWPQVRALNTKFQKFVCVDGDGRTLAVLKAGPLRQALEMDEFWVEVMRTDLSRILYDETRRKTEFSSASRSKRYPTMATASVSALKAEPSAASTSSLPRTASAPTCAISRSARIRPSRKYLGYYVAVAPIENSEPTLHTALNYSEPGRGIYLYRPTDRDAVLAFFMFTQKEKLDCGPHESARHKEILAQGMKGMGWKVPELVAKAMDVSDLYFDSVSQVRMPSWSKGRVALLGDAAFAPSFLTGQGTQLAFTSAYRLAGELKRAQGDHERAFGAYEAALKPVVEAIQKQIGLNSPLMIPETRLGIWLRNRFVPLAVSLLTMTAWAWKGLLPRKPSRLVRDY